LSKNLRGQAAPGPATQPQLGVCRSRSYPGQASGLAAERENPLLAFGCAIVEATADLVCAFKPNLGFWLAEGVPGLVALGP